MAPLLRLHMAGELKIAAERNLISFHSWWMSTQNITEEDIMSKDGMQGIIDDLYAMSKKIYNYSIKLSRHDTATRKETYDIWTELGWASKVIAVQTQKLERALKEE